MNPKPGIILIGSSISLLLTAVLWACKAAGVLIMFTLPGSILAWAVTAALSTLGLVQSQYFDLTRIGLLTSGNAAFCSPGLHALCMRPERTVK